MRNGLILLLLFLSIHMKAQTNVRAWYAEGQVWVIWNISLPVPETYAIYKGPQPFTSTSQATIIGRPFGYECLPGTFIQQTGDTTFTYKIPKPDGSVYTLATGEALFVETVMADGASYYAVTEWGNTSVTADINITQGPVQYNYDPVGDPVSCHLQYSNVLPGNFKANWYCLWLLGKQAQWSGRPDYPVLANAFKNGMPAMFIVSEATGMDTTGGKQIPLTHWFHGGGGLAIHHTADKTKQFNIAPLKGISASHNDDFPHLLIYDGDTLVTSGRTAWFGYAKNFNPFNPGADTGPGDTVVNYTQRRILWINNWLINHYRANPDQVALQGYSMGSGGASALGKAYPNLFSTISAFNNGYRRVNEETITAMQGTVEENLPTSLRYANNEAVHLNEVMDLNTPISSMRDMPLFRLWAGKNDINDRMHWGPDLVAQYRIADSLGWGTQISWDERAHTYPVLGMHWILDLGMTQQTYRDNLAFQEFFNSKQSFPAFFNHRLDPQNNNPGTGMQGINTGDGDNWGTWGGYHNWDLQTISDEPDQWAATAWLTATAPFPADISPANSLLADLAIRKPQQFKPAAGSQVEWKVKDLFTGEVLQSGTGTVAADSLVLVPQVRVYKENIRSVRIEVSKTIVSDLTVPEHAGRVSLSVIPNPSAGQAFLAVHCTADTEATLRICGLDGRSYLSRIYLYDGRNTVPLSTFSTLPAGFYGVELITGNFTTTTKWLKG